MKLSEDVPRKRLQRFGGWRVARLVLLVVSASACVALISAASSEASSPPWPQRSELSGSSDVELFGYSSAVTGSTMAVGAIGYNSGAGAVYVFAKTGKGWVKQATLIASDSAPNENFGASVAVSSNMIVVGASGRNSSEGAAYVFTKSGNTWTQQAELTAKDGAANDFFGASVAIMDDLVVVGGNEEHTGSVYVFAPSGQTWTQQTEFTATDAATKDLFGYSLAVDGNQLVVGAPGHNSFTGAAYVFKPGPAHSWSQQAEFSDTAAAPEGYFGYSVAIDGSTIAVGAPFNAVTNRGAAYVFVPSAHTWAQQATLTASDDSAAAPFGDWFGYNVAIEGMTVAVTAPYHTSNGKPYAGAAYVFTGNGPGHTWTKQTELIPSDSEAEDYFGYGLTLEDNTLVIGAPYKPIATRQGHLYTFGS